MFYFQTFREGISFLNRTEARQLKEELSSGSLMRATERNLSHDEGDKIELICKNIRQQSDYDWTKVLSINYIHKLQSFNDCLMKNVELVSKELNHFGVIAGLFRQIGGHSSRFVLFCSF